MTIVQRIWNYGSKPNHTEFVLGQFHALVVECHTTNESENKALFVGFLAGYAFYGLVLIWLTTYLGLS